MPTPIAGQDFYLFGNGNVADNVPGTTLLDPAPGVDLIVRDVNNVVMTVRNPIDQTVMTLRADQLGRFPRFLAPMLQGTVGVGNSVIDVVTLEAAQGLLDVVNSVIAAEASATDANNSRVEATLAKTRAEQAEERLNEATRLIIFEYNASTGWGTVRPANLVGRRAIFIMPPNALGTWASGPTWRLPGDIALVAGGVTPV